MKGWKEARLGDISQYINRGFSPKYVESNGEIIINQKCIRDGKIDYSFSKLTDKFKPVTPEKILRVCDILVNSTGIGTAGRVGIFTQNIFATADSHVSIVRIDANNSYPKFVFYNLRQRETDIESFAEGSTGQIELGRDRIKEIDILLPPLPEQRAIAGVLSSLDDKIDLLHRQNKTLEAMAEALFRQWFVEEADAGWEEVAISEVIEFNPNRKLPKGTIAPYLEMSELSTTTFMPGGWYEREFSSGTKFKNGDTLLARITPCLENGKSAFITFLHGDEVAWGSTEYIVMRPKDGIQPFFAYCLVRNKEFRDYAEGCLEGSSGRQRVNVDHLVNFKIIKPDQSSVERFNRFANSVVPKLHQNSVQIRSLESLRDTLLPKLMSGEVRVEL